MGVTRLFQDVGLEPGALLPLDARAVHHLAVVLRLRAGDPVHVFNERDGEWAAVLREVGRRSVLLEVVRRHRAPETPHGPSLILAPIRPSRLDWLIEKAVELGVGGVLPVLTERTVVRLGKPQRLQAIAREAAEQCGRLDVPTIAEPVELKHWLAARDPVDRVLFADEAGEATPILEAPAGALLIGPEGGFAPGERAALRAAPGILPVSLGPLILRAETAAIAGLAAIMLAAVRPSWGRG